MTLVDYITNHTNQNIINNNTIIDISKNKTNYNICPISPISKIINICNISPSKKIKFSNERITHNFYLENQEKQDYWRE